MSEAPQPIGSGRRLFRQFATLGGGKGAGAVLGLVYLAIAAQALGAETLGVLVLIHAFTLVFSEVVSFKSWQAVIRYGADDLAQGREDGFKHLVRLCLIVDLASALAAALLAAGLVLAAGNWVGLPDAALPVAAVYGFVNLFNLKAAAVGVLRLFERFDLLALHAQIQPLVRVAGTAIAAFAGGGLVAFASVWFLASAAAGLALPLLAARELKRRGLWAGLFSARRETAHAGLWRFMIFSNAASTVKLGNTHIPPLLVGAILGPGGAALYKVAQEIAGALVKAAQMVEQVVYPELARLIAARRTAEAARLAPRAALAALSAGLAFTVLVWMFDEQVLGLLFGREFAGAAPLLVWLSAAAAVLAAASPVDPVLYAFGAPQRAMWLQGLGAAITVAGMVIFMPMEGLAGAGHASLVSALVFAGAGAASAALMFRRALREAEKAA